MHPLRSGNRITMPLYTQVKQVIREMVEAGQLGPGDRVPGERELAERFGVSRMTARQALNELELEGVVVRAQGKGTFVAPPKIGQALVALTSFTEDMMLRGMVPGARYVKVDVAAATPDIAELLALTLPRQVWRIERLRTADDEPMALEISHVPHRLCPDLDAHLAREGSLYRVFERVYGFSLARATQTIEAALASQEEAKALGIRPRMPVLLCRRLTYRDDGVPIEYVKSVYRADRYRFVAEMVRPGEAVRPAEVAGRSPARG